MESSTRDLFTTARQAITPDTVLVALRGHIGREHGVTAKDLARELTGNVLPAGERRLRDVIVELRMQGHHVCGRPDSGYFMAANAEELQDTCLFLHDRAMTSLQQVARMKNVALPDLRGQLHLPT